MKPLPRPVLRTPARTDVLYKGQSYTSTGQAGDTGDVGSGSGLSRMHGIGSSSRRGVLSSMLSLALSNRPPSMYRPYTYTPVGGGEVTSLGSRAVISHPICRVSTPTRVARAWLCLTLVMNPKGEKKQDSQYAGRGPRGRKDGTERQAGGGQ